jgi:hypothetical protein
MPTDCILQGLSLDPGERANRPRLPITALQRSSLQGDRFHCDPNKSGSQHRTTQHAILLLPDAIGSNHLLSHLELCTLALARRRQIGKG